MALTVEAYDPIKIEKLKLYLQSQADKGYSRYFEIYVDNLKVVNRTNELIEFDNYQDYITEDSQRVRILVFSNSPTSPRNDQFTYTLKEKINKPDVAAQEALSGMELEARFDEKLRVERERWEADLLKKELEKTQSKLAEAEEYIDELEEKLNEVKQKPNSWGKLDLGLLAGSALEGMIRKNPQWLNKVPGLEGLAGAIVQENNEPYKIEQPESEVSFSKKSADSTLSDEEKSYLEFGKQVAENFEDHEIELLVKIIDSLGKDSSQLKPVAELIGIKTN